MKNITQAIDQQDIELLDAHYQAAIHFKGHHKYKASENEWKAFGEIVDQYIDKGYLFFENESYESYIKDLAHCLVTIPVSEEAMLKSYYNSAQSFEKILRFRDAEILWDKFNTILSKYIK